MNKKRNLFAIVLLLAMVLSVFANVAWRNTSTDLVVRTVTIDYTDTTDGAMASGKEAFKLPKYGHIINIQGILNTTFNTQTSATLEIGKLGDLDYYSADVDLKSDVDNLFDLGIIPASTTATTPVLVSVVNVGTAPTAGKVTLIFTYTRK